MKHSGGEWIIIRSVFYVLLSATLLLSSFFVAQAISPGDLVILRLQITGGTGKTDNDFVTIYNKSSAEIDLNGLRLVKRTKTAPVDVSLKSWTSPLFLNPGGVYTWANSNYALFINANTSSTQTLANDNSIAIRNGSENSGEIIDTVGWGSVQNSLWEETPYATNPGANEILQRTNNQDTNNNALDFQLSYGSPMIICGNNFIESPETCDDGNLISGDGCDSSCHLEIVLPVCGNGISESGEECDDGNGLNGDGCNIFCQSETLGTSAVCGNGVVESNEECDDGDILAGDGCSASCQTEVVPESTNVQINEFVADPISGNDEWVELFSDDTLSFSITDWTIEDGSGSKTRLVGNIGGAQPFFIVEKPSGSLNNAGDIIILRNKVGEIIDQVTYGDWNDGDISDNAPMTTDPFSIALIPEVNDSGNDSLEYAITTTVTKGQLNIITPIVIEGETEDDENYDFSQAIFISEIFPNPVGIDDGASEKEFIELYNDEDRPVNLEGWRIEVGSKEYVYEFPPETIIDSKNYLILFGPGLNGSENFKLNNDGATIKLFQPQRQTAYQTVTYKETVEGQSWILIHENNVGANKVWQWTAAPTPAGSNLQVLPPKALFSFTGKFEVGEKIIFDSSDSESGGLLLTYNWNFGDNSTSTEMYPEHSYKTTGTFTVVLTIKNSFGTATVSKKIKIAKKPEIEAAVLAAVAYDNENSATVALGSTLSGNSLSNLIKINEIFPNPTGKDDGQEWVEIINASENDIDLGNWRIGNKSKKGTAFENTTLKSGEIFVVSGSFLPTLGNTEDTVVLFDPNGKEIDKISYTKAPENQSYSRLNLKWQWTESSRGLPNAFIDSKEEASGDSKKDQVSDKSLSGIVVSLPGTFSTQYFFVKVEGSEVLYQVYNSKKLFPDLKIGQQIQVIGELGSTDAGPRFKTDTATDIKIIGVEALEEIKVSNSLEVNKPPYPRLVKVSGEVTSKKNPRLILTDETGDIEIYFAKGSSLSITNFSIGDKLEVTGVVELSGTTARVMPRGENDINILNALAGPISTTSGETISTDLGNHLRDNKKSLVSYIGLAAAAVLGGGGYWFWKYKNNKK